MSSRHGSRWLVVPAIVLGFLSTAFYTPLLSAAASPIEEVIVTAQRTEESVQDVPIAVTALTGEILEDRQIINPSDLQLNAPNVSFTATNFGGSSFSIRGIGRLVIAASGENGVSTHINEIAVGTNLPAVEFYDVERVEILRGPQGTLFGRNATGGAVNIVTKRPDFDGWGGFIDAELGDYEHQRLKGALNIPVTDNLAFRVAGMMLNRDGYIDNIAYGQEGQDAAGNPNGQFLQGIDDDIDGRDVYTFRVTGEWAITDRANLWVQYSKFKEDDDKVRITNQVCQRTDVPSTGCEPDGFGFDNPHLGTTTGGIFGGMSALAPLTGALPLGSPGGNDDPLVHYAFPKPATNDFRDMHTDFEPEYYYDEDLWLFGFTYDFDNFTVGLQGAYQESEYIARQDYLMDVGPTLQPTLLNPTGQYPTSEVSGDFGRGFSGEQCQYENGTAGIYGGCVHPSDQTRIFAYDQASSKSEGWNIEAKVSSSFEGMFNFILGASTYEGTSHGGDYYVNANTLDLVGYQGVPVLGFPPLYPTLFNVPGDSDYKTGDGYAVFGEVYLDVTDNVRITAGLRYNKDEKYTRSTSVLYNAVDANVALGFPDELAAACTQYPDVPPGLYETGLGGPGVACPYWSRNTGFLVGAPFDAALVEFYGATAAFEAAALTAPYSAERLAADQLIPLTPAFNETRALTNSPDTAEWDETTGRIGVDWAITDNSMVYAFFSRGYKPGGFNPPINPTFQSTSAFTFDAEEIDSFEIGSKNILFDGQVMLNASLFVYDYTGLQVTRIKNNSSINDNIDADIWGFEVEGFYSPEALPGLQLDFQYSYLNTEVAGSESVDPINRTAGNPDWIVLQNIDPGSLTGVNYIAPVESTLAATPAAIAEGGALSDANGLAVPGTVYPNGIPAYFSRNWLEANVGAGTTSDGLNQSLDGNSLPNSPEHTVHIGAAYTWQIGFLRGALTARWDYYWQDESYAREFNSIGDEIDAWDQHNASLIYESANGQWVVKAWVRNIQDEDNVTGKYLTSDTSGFFRNYFLTEPRIYGASVRFAFGAD
jgi:outer membrane receptor protein involved in Fe transport